jgi:Spy/CpxP family protein refolding chaperone
MLQIMRLAIAFFFVAGTWAVGSAARAEIITKIPGDFGWRKSVPLQYVQEQGVIEEFKLTAEVSEELRKLNRRIVDEVEAEQKNAAPVPARDRPRGYVRKYEHNDPLLHAARNRHREEIDKLLTAEQQTRLHQIHLQRQPNRFDVLADSGVAEALGLSNEQRAALSKIFREKLRAEMNNVKGIDSPPPPPNRDGRLMEVLTEEQRQAFEKLLKAP